MIDKNLYSLTYVLNDIKFAKLLDTVVGNKITELFRHKCNELCNSISHDMDEVLTIQNENDCNSEMYSIDGNIIWLPSTYSYDITDGHIISAITHLKYEKIDNFE